jgi:hypothetical protein
VKIVRTLLFTLSALGGLSGFSGSRCEATIYNSNGSAASVQALHDAAREGDTITIPAGRFSWSSGVTITKGITLQGQTTTNSANGTAVDNTIIQDSDARRRDGGYPFITLNSVLGKSYRITGLTFDGGAATIKNYNGAIQLAGNSHSVRLDHCSFRASLTKEAMYVGILGAIWGVADHNVIKAQVPASAFDFYMANWPNPNGTAGVNGDGSFATPTNFGSQEFFFVEDNYLEALPPGGGTGTDDLRGGRWVFRHNHCYGNVQVQGHGTENGRWRGGRAREIYNNDFHRNANYPIGGVRSGVTVVHDNTFEGVQPGQNSFQLQAYRSFFKWAGCPFAGAIGDNLWDVNDPHGLYQSGTCTAGSDRNHIVDTTKNWTRNRWAGFTAKFTGDNQVAHIESNTSNTLNVVFYTDSGGGHVWHAGDGYQIHKLLIALDQPGRGQGDLIVGDPPVNSRTGTAAWPNQALEPTYSWNNIYTPTGAHVNITTGAGGFMLVQGRDYFNNTPMPGYTPYVYPHPLVSSADAVSDFNSDGKPDFVLYNSSTGQTVVWSMDNNVHVTGNNGPTLPAGWSLVSVADFNRDGHPDYLLFNPSTGQTVIWYLSRTTFLGANHGPTLPSGWELVATGDFNDDGKPDFVLYNPSTRQTVVWYMDKNVHVSGYHGPTLPAGWSLVGVADFNGDRKPDYLLFNPSTGQSVIWYLSRTTHIGTAAGPTIAAGYNLTGTADFDGNGKPDYLLYNPSTHQTAIYYMDNNVLIGTADGPTLPGGWSLVAP